MEVLFDILEVLIIIGWIAFALFGSKIFKRKNKRQERNEYPEFPQQEGKTPETAEEISEEERKLKEWLEGVFGGGKKKQEPAWEDYEETDEGEELALPQTTVSACHSNAEQDQLQHDFSFSAPEVKIEASKKNVNAWQGRIGKSQMAYGLVMSEIFQKPRALRPFSITQVNRKKSL